MTPLAAVVSGEDLQAARVRSRDARLAGPLPAAIHAGDIVEVAALAFAGSAAERRGWRARRVGDFGDPRAQIAGTVPWLWLLAMGIGAAWADDAAATDAWADALAGLEGGDWRESGVGWLRALARRARGEDAPLGAAGLPGLASFEALLRVDAAHADPGAAAGARAALVALGAEPYAAALLPETSGQQDPLTPLSDREREVAALLLEGLSYAQIAKELYVTRSTVAFHLSKVYAKTGTTTRHELVQLTRPPGERR
jgi:DNA-binding CsgD family transcriptional regulator